MHDPRVAATPGLARNISRPYHGSPDRLAPAYRTSCRLRNLPIESRVYLLLAQSGIKPAADVEVGPEDAKWFGSYLKRLKIQFVTSENDEEHGSGVTFYLLKDVSETKALKALDEQIRRSTPDKELFEELGGLYGIPRCCTGRFVEREKASLPIVHPEEFDYIYHVPCNPDCRESQKLGRRIRVTLEKHDPETLVRWRDYVRDTTWFGNEDSDKASLESLAADVMDCTLCPLARARTKAVPGEGPDDARILIIGEAPGREEDASGRPFVGRAGKILSASLDRAGIKRDEVFITNVVKCRPPRNRPPARREIETCYNTYLSRQIHLLKPRVTVEEFENDLKGLMNEVERLLEEIAVDRKVRQQVEPLVLAELMPKDSG